MMDLTDIVESIYRGQKVKTEPKGRVYRVKNKNRSGPDALVRAMTRDRAIDAVARHGFEARPAKADDVLELTAQGVTVIDATKAGE